MLTGKQRRYLKSLSNTLLPSIKVGKQGVTENIIEEIDSLLENKELIKIDVLKNSLNTKEEIIEQIVDKLGAEYVQSLGNKITIYRESKRKKKINL